MATTTFTVTSVRKNNRTLGYNVDGQFVTWSGAQYSCSCGKFNCEHSQAVSAQIKSDREARQAHDAEVAAKASQTRKFAEAEVGRQRRESASLNGNQGFSMFR